jgi:hypothetical protein
MGIWDWSIEKPSWIVVMDYLVQSLWDKSSSWDTMALMHLTSNHTKTKTLSFLSLGSSLPLIFCIHVRSGPIYWEGYLPCRKDYKVMVCKKPKNIICDSILHVNMFHYFRIPYFTCTIFTKFTYNEYIGPYFLSHVVLRFSPVISPSFWVQAPLFANKRIEFFFIQTLSTWWV